MGWDMMGWDAFTWMGVFGWVGYGVHFAGIFNLALGWGMYVHWWRIRMDGCIFSKCGFLPSLALLSKTSPYDSIETR